MAAETAAAEKLRMCLKMIRSLDTMPSHVLSNGKTASETAHLYILAGKLKRGAYKQRRAKKRALRSNSASKAPSKKRNVDQAA